MTGSKLPSANDYIAFDTPNLAATYEVGKYTSATGAFTSVNGGTMNIAEGLFFHLHKNRPLFDTIDFGHV